MQNRTRTRIYQIEFYSVKMIDQAFGLVCMGARAHVCVCISSYMSCGWNTNTQIWITWSHISTYKSSERNKYMWGKKNKTANNAMQRETDASVCVAKSVLVGSWVFLLLCYFCALSAFFSRLLQWNWIKYIHQYRCAISYLADTNTLQFSDRLSMLHLFHYIFDFILNANSSVYELFRIIRDL